VKSLLPEIGVIGSLAQDVIIIAAKTDKTKINFFMISIFIKLLIYVIFLYIPKKEIEGKRNEPLNSFSFLFF